MHFPFKALVVSVAAAATLSAATWQVDTAHSGAHFSVRHMMVSNVRGEFGGLRGTVEYDPAAPEKAQVDVTIDAATLDTRQAKRDAHLKNPDFFDVARYPTIAFRSKRVERAGEGKLHVIGDLTLHGVTREVVLQVDGPSPEIKDQRGNLRMGASATTRLNRKDFGMTWNRAMDAGGVVVGDEVQITLDIELVRKP
jgi:polyisoprenoid-binding protein YceI